MFVPLRAPLAAVIVAAVGVTVLNAPSASMPSSMPSSMPVAQIALAGFDNPVGQLLATAEVAQDYLFGAYYNAGDTVTPGAGEANWPSAGLDQSGGALLNYALYNEVSLGYYSYVGLLPNTAASAVPVLRQLQNNLSDYINVTLSGVLTAVSDLAEGVWEFPSAVLTSVQLLVQGQLSAALTALGDAIVAPISTAAQSLLNAGGYVLSRVAARLGAVIAALPGIASTFARAVLGGAQILAAKSVAILRDVVSNVTALDAAGAWNTAVDGLLGPSGLPGTVLNLTIGAGIQTGPIVDPAGIPANFVPSLRTASQAAVWTIQNALATDPAEAAAVAGAAGKRLATRTGERARVAAATAAPRTTDEPLRRARAGR